MTSITNVSNADVDDMIVSSNYYTFPDSGVTVCTLMLKNGYVATGEALEGGSSAAHANARSKIWALEKYARMSRLAGL